MYVIRTAITCPIGLSLFALLVWLIGVQLLDFLIYSWMNVMACLAVALAFAARHDRIAAPVVTNTGRLY